MIDPRNPASPTYTEWWLATLGRTVVWARLRVREAGTAEVFDSDGNCCYFADIFLIYIKTTICNI